MTTEGNSWVNVKDRFSLRKFNISTYEHIIINAGETCAAAVQLKVKIKVLLEPTLFWYLDLKQKTR